MRARERCHRPPLIGRWAGLSLYKALGVRRAHHRVSGWGGCRAARGGPVPGTHGEGAPPRWGGRAQGRPTPQAGGGTTGLKSSVPSPRHTMSVLEAWLPGAATASLSSGRQGELAAEGLPQPAERGRARGARGTVRRELQGSSQPEVGRGGQHRAPTPLTGRGGGAGGAVTKPRGAGSAERSALLAPR